MVETVYNHIEACKKFLAQGYIAILYGPLRERKTFVKTRASTIIADREKMSRLLKFSQSFDFFFLEDKVKLSL